MDDLPVEVKLNIFSYLSSQDLCQTVAPVSDRWAELAYDSLMGQPPVSLYPALFDYISVRDYKALWEQKKNMITHVNLYRLEDEQVELLDLLPDLPRLTTLKIFYYITPSHRHLGHLVSQCAGVSELWFHVNEISLPTLTQILLQLPDLNRLSFYAPLKNTEELVQLIANVPPLQRLQFSAGGYYLSDANLKTLLQRHAPSLTHLKLDSHDYTNKAIEMLGPCTQLTTLMVSYCHRLTSLRPVADLLQLTSLTLCENSSIQPEALMFLALPHLTYLKLKRMRLSKRVLSQIIKGCPRLTTFLLMDCKLMTDYEGEENVCDHILSPLLDGTSLHHLIVRTPNHCTPDFIDRLSQLPHLTIFKFKTPIPYWDKGRESSSVLKTWFEGPDRPR